MGGWVEVGWMDGGMEGGGGLRVAAMQTMWCFHHMGPLRDMKDEGGRSQ